MITPTAIRQEITNLTLYLMKVGLAEDQNTPFQKASEGMMEVTFPQAKHVSIALKDRSYADIYRQLAEVRAYNIKMPDGALIQLMYRFDQAARVLQSHRLAFFPAPHLEEFQNNPEIYLEDETYADVVARGIVPFPIRFDYDIREDVCQELVHPKSHLTLGQYEGCRIPVTSALTPFWFIDFLLRNFYDTESDRYADQLPRSGLRFEESILPAERKVVHLAVPFS